MFLTDEQYSLALEIAALLTGRGETVAVSESTTGGLLSAALLSVGGASQYFAGGGVVYTLASRTALAGVSAESGLAGPTGGRFGAPAGKTTLSVAGPVTRTEVMETGISDRIENMVKFTTLALRFLKQATQEANG
jgi:nicotinamide-nucleotide amidase